MVSYSTLRSSSPDTPRTQLVPFLTKLSCSKIAIQLAKLSGFSPIITTASSQHSEYLTTLGATHVVPHDTSPSDLQSLAKKPVDIIYVSVTTEANLPQVVDIVAKGGKLIITMPRLLPNAKALAEPKGLKVSTMFASPYAPHVEQFGVEMYEALTGLLADGSLVPNRVQVVEGGLGAIPDAVKLFAQKTISGVKLVGRPQETV